MIYYEYELVKVTLEVATLEEVSVESVATYHSIYGMLGTIDPNMLIPYFTTSIDGEIHLVEYRVFVWTVDTLRYELTDDIQCYDYDIFNNEDGDYCIENDTYVLEQYV